MFCVIIFLFSTLNTEGKNQDVRNLSSESWSGSWFPSKPIEALHKQMDKNVEVNRTKSLEEIYDKREHLFSYGRPFAVPDTETNKNNLGKYGSQQSLSDTIYSNTWTGKWFPFSPTNSSVHQKDNAIKEICDDGNHFIDVDFDPRDKRHSYNYLCLANKSLYVPDISREAILVEHLVPKSFVVTVKCQNETISYDEVLPTFGAFRFLPPKYGTYKYLPVQRWMHGLATGAIVLLYHPCAYPAQIKQLENILKACLYRHIITPSQAPSPERPLILLSWGKSLQMSVVDNKTVINFIKNNAKHGPLLPKKDDAHNSYSVSLLSEAHLITDADDSIVCGYQEM